MLLWSLEKVSTMRPQSCKAKGRRLQQQIVADLLERFPQLEDDDVRSTSMGAHGEDVQLSPAARTLIPYSFEAKNQERLNLWASISQAETNKPTGVHAAIVVKKNGQPAYAVIRWSQFLDLISPAVGGDADDEHDAEDDPSLSSELETIAAHLLRLSRSASTAREP